jgi:hypothetical protein
MLFIMGEKSYGNSDWPSFVSEKYKKQLNKNSRSQKWYGNRKILVEVEMEMVVALSVEYMY